MNSPYIMWVAALGPILAVLLTYLLQRHKIQEVHMLVNSNFQRVLSENARLEGIILRALKDNVDSINGKIEGTTPPKEV